MQELGGMPITLNVVLMLIFFILEQFIAYSACLQLTKPINTVSSVRSRVKMECSSYSSLLPADWAFAPAGANNFSYIYINKRIPYNLISKYKIETDDKTRYDIVMDSVELSHAGTYRCMPITSDFKNVTSFLAELIVIASDPVCDTNSSSMNGGIVEGVYIQMWCTFNYSGNWIPVIQWTINDESAVEDNRPVLHTSTPTTVTSSFTIQLNYSYNGVTFACRTSFNKTVERLGSSADNVPAYHQLWNFTANVLYAPRNLSLTPMKSVYEIGDRLECSADGNPTPTYEWMEIETTRTIYGSVLTIEDYMRSDQNNSFKCTASNRVAGSRKQIDETITFTVKEKSRTPTEHSIIISVIVVGGICCLVLALFICNNQRSHKIARAEPDIVQAAQINQYADSSIDQPTVRPRAAQGVQSPGIEGELFQQRQLLLAVYTEVHKKEKYGESCSMDEGATGYLPWQQGLPIYTKVTKKKDESTNPVEPYQTVQPTATQYRFPPKDLTGANGTHYVELNSVCDPNPRIPTRHHNPMFSKVETYASIDHTVNAPPPPLPPKAQMRNN